MAVIDAAAFHPQISQLRADELVNVPLKDSLIWRLTLTFRLLIDGFSNETREDPSAGD
jgi:hypothetical protein